MKHNKKKTMIIGGIVAAAFVTPLVVMAVMYFSNERVNTFSPATVDIEVREDGLADEQGEQLDNTIEMDDSKVVNKPVQIYDSRSNDDEELRVCFVPMWYDADDNICGSVFSIGTPTMSGTALTYTDGDKSITLNLDADWESNGWRYSDPNDTTNPGDGYFYYSGSLKYGKLTPQLLDRVELSDDAYVLTTDYKLRIDVLADAIQTSGNAAGTRDWTEVP